MFDASCIVGMVFFISNIVIQPALRVNSHQTAKENYKLSAVSMVYIVVHEYIHTK